MSASLSSVTRCFKIAAGFAATLVMSGLGACSQQSLNVTTGALPKGTGHNGNNVDILFMIDNSSSMTAMQDKLVAQLSMLTQAMQALPTGVPDVHIAVVSSDMGAPGDAAGSDGCTTVGNGGVFFNQPENTCTSTMLQLGATYVSDVGGVANYTGDLADVLSCLMPLGDRGCGFEQPLASVARALGADGQPAPSQNAGFLRDDAELAIILLTNEDDCSAPVNTKLFSLGDGGSGSQSLENPLGLGPLANYRCNEFGHLCVDPTSTKPQTLIEPPLNPPTDAQGPATSPSLALASCVSNDTVTGLLTPVSTFVRQIKSLKVDPDNQIVVGAIVAPPAPYTVSWQPSSGGSPGATGELWPQIEHSCGVAGDANTNPAATQTTADGSFGDPGVRITQWVQAFGSNGLTASICDGSYAAAFQAIAQKIGAHLEGPSTGLDASAGLDAGG